MNFKINQLAFNFVSMLLIASSMTNSAFAQNKEWLATKQINTNHANSVNQTDSKSILEIQKAWIRANVSGQKSTGAFMQLKAAENLTLIGASSPIASVVQIHEMKHENNVMKMREIPDLALPANQLIEFKSGSYHLMLMDLKQTLTKNEQIPLTLRIRTQKGDVQEIQFSFLVSNGISLSDNQKVEHRQTHQH